MQRPRLTSLTVDAAETLADEWASCGADGAICPNDIAHLTPLIRLVVVQSMDADVALAAGMAMMRIGPEAPRTKTLLREVPTSFQPHFDEAA
ncbi:MAG: hypothetical protein WKF63_09625 [Thermomicrobiales bacterium]